MQRRDFLKSSALFGAFSALPVKWAAAAEGATDSLRILSEGAANSLESFSVGINRNAIQVSWNVYDRLVRFAYQPWADGDRKPGEDATFYYDYYDIQPELAESYALAEDGKSITFKLRPDATFHDGSPVTAEDVKWSLDRVVASPIGLAQFSTGSMTSPDQFVVVDPLTLRIDLPEADRLALPNLALTYPIIVNAKLAKQHATADDPFASEWLKTNTAAGGAYQIERLEMGERILFSRFDGWKSGPLPAVRQILWQTVPAPENRLALLLKGDADVVQDIPPKDVAKLEQDASVRVIGAPTSNFQFIAMNTQTVPFDDVRVRQAIAYALPYEDMLQTAIFGRAKPLFGGKPGAPETTEFPQPLGFATDLDRARALLAEAGLKDGFETTFSYELSNATVAEPVALLLQEALGKIGIRVGINKVPAGQLGTLLQEKKVPFYFEGSISYLANPDYFFRIFYVGDTRWNFGSYQNPELEALVEKARYESDAAAYGIAVKRMIELAKTDVPIIFLWHPMLDVGMQKDVRNYSFNFHRQLDFRPLAKS